MIDVDLDRPCFRYTGERFISWLTAMPGVKWEKRSDYADIPITPFHAETISRHEREITESAQSMIVACLEDQNRFRAFLEKPIAPCNFNAPFTLFDHQNRAIRAIQQLECRAMLADEMGLGKTQVAITVFRLMAQPPPLLVVCPASIKWKWKNDLEANEIGSDVIEGYKPFITIKHDKWHIRDGFFHALIVNYDLISKHGALVSDLARFIDGGMLILDESHYVKEAGSKRTKACAKLASLARQLLLLTGTPVRNTILDLYSQLQMIRPGMWRNKWEFEDRYFVRQEVNFGGRRFMKNVGIKNQGELEAIVATTQIRRLKKDVTNLPDKIYTTIPLDFDAESRKLYEKMADKWLYDFSMLGGDTPMLDQRAKTAVEAAMRLEQICQGFLGPAPETLIDKALKRMDDLTPPGSVAPQIIQGGVVFPKNPKYEWLKEFMDELEGKKIIIFFKFNATLFSVGHYLADCGKSSVHMTGEATQDQRAERIQAFQLGKYDAFLCQVKIAEGFDLTVAQHVVFWGRDWSPAVNSQAEDRAHRIGQTGVVNVHTPIIRNSIEEKIHEVLKEKKSIANVVLGDIRKAIEATK